jgi:nucleoside-diphosphate-sugar epimerase
VTFWQERPVLVTGGCGFIGSHLVEALLERGARVQVLGRYSSNGSYGNLEEAADRWGDRLAVELATVTDLRTVRRLVDAADTVFHLAALIGIPYSYVAPEHNVEVNVLGTLRVLEAARDAPGVRRIIHTSTSETFGSAQRVPMDESHPLVGQSPYAASKIAADQLAVSYHRSFGTPVVTLRPFNTFGPRQSNRAVVPTIVSQLLAGPIVRLGATWPVRDMNPVANTVDAFLLAATAEGVEGEDFNVGSGSGVSVEDMVRTAAAIVGVEPQIKTDPQRTRPPASEVDRLIADHAKATARLGYEPRMGFDDGMRAVVDHLRAAPPRRAGYAR